MNREGHIRATQTLSVYDKYKSSHYLYHIRLNTHIKTTRPIDGGSNGDDNNNADDDGGKDDDEDDYNNDGIMTVIMPGNNE